MTVIQADHVTVRFGTTTALSAVSFEIHDQEIFFIMGPSGCGKSTLLRSISGLQSLNGGEIYFDGRPSKNLSIADRHSALVFQSYCLWPHMTVFENIAFGLTVQRRPRQEIARRVSEILEITELKPYADRFPHELSGGQQQRVSLARALVLRPRVLLLDEPFSNLDRSLRASIRNELMKVHAQFRLTMIFVSHEYRDALDIGNRVLLLEAGRRTALGSPLELYRTPPTAACARLTGEVVHVPSIFAADPLFARPESFYLDKNGIPNGRVISTEHELSQVRLTIEVGPDQRAIPILISSLDEIPLVGASVSVAARAETFFALSGVAA